MTKRRRGGRGGQGGSEPRVRIRLRELQVMELTIEGRSQHQIAAALSISQAAVSKILRRIEDRLLADISMRVERQRARHTYRLEHLYGEAMRAWGRSQQDSLRRRQRKQGDGTGQAMAELVSENQHGDPRYLDEARKVLADLRDVWGLNATERVAVESASPFLSMTDAALAAEISRQRQFLDRSTESPLPALPKASEPNHEA